jgi:hypothetical protein
MTRPLPAALAAIIKPIPPDFQISLDDHGKYVRWTATLAVDGHGPVDVELGYSKAGGKADEAAERSRLRARAWQAMELARLGRADLLDYCSTDRHKRQRPISRLQMT